MDTTTPVSIRKGACAASGRTGAARAVRHVATRYRCLMEDPGYSGSRSEHHVAFAVVVASTRHRTADSKS
jgi:hypothetical protein